MDHAVDLIGNGLCQFIIVPGIVTVDRDIHTAKVGRPGHTSSGQSCLWEVPARAIEVRQGQFRQAEGTDALHALLYFRSHRLDLADQTTLILLDAAGKQLHEVWHIGIRICQRSFIRHGEVQERADTACHALDRIANPADTFLDATSDTTDDVFTPADCRGSHVLDTTPDRGSHIADGRCRIGDTILDGVYSIREYRGNLVPDIRDPFPESITVFPERGQSKTDAADCCHSDTSGSSQTSKGCTCRSEHTSSRRCDTS